MAVMFSVPGPVLVRVTGWPALLVPTVWPAKVRLAGESVTTGADATAVPLSETDCGLPLALSVMLTEAVLVPAAVGVKVTVMVQVPFTAMVAGQLLLCE